jgi:hypothetical protein
MGINANSFSLRGESGLVKIVSDSVFVPRAPAEACEDEAECDVIVESNGFRVNKAAKLKMGSILSFLVDLGDVVRRRSGTAEFLGAEDDLSIVFICEGEAKVECRMSDRNEGKENSVRVKYPIEPSYFEELEAELAAFRGCSAKGA